MGYHKTLQTINIKFGKDHKCHGLEVVAHGMSIGTYLKVTGHDGGDGETIGETIDRLGKSIVSWNYEDDDGNPIPPTPEEFASIDQREAMALASAWLDGLAGVHEADPLPASSPSGELSQVASIPMEALSGSLAS